MKKKSLAIFTALILTSSLASYMFGIKVTTETYSKELDAVQTILAFNHLKTYQKILKCNENNNTNAVSQNLKMNIISEKELIANYLNQRNIEHVNEYISLRHSKQISELKNYKSNRASRWSEPSCN